MKFFKCLLFSIFLSLLILNSSLLIKNAKAADAFPDGGKVPCDVIKDPEFNSTRPYQASPCGDAPKALFCGNSVVATVGSVSTEYCGADVCPCIGNKCSGQVSQFIVDLTNVKLPVLGNTQDVVNSKNPDDKLSDGTKVNEYVSWYLAGVNNKAEYGGSKNGPDATINFSGPIQKLLPGAIQDAQRIETINNIGTPTTYTDDDTQDQVTDKAENHNQIVVCANKTFFGLFGDATPQECYKNEILGTTKYRLSDWQNGDLGLTRNFSNEIISLLLKIPGMTNSLINESLSEAWNKRIPPVPWGEGPDGKPFESYVKYQKAYNEWRGKSCVIVPFVNFLICFDLDPTNIFISSDWAKLYPYIPLANTTDKKSNQAISSVEIQSSDATIDSKDYELVKSPAFYFAHTEESAELSRLLQSTFKPQPGTKNSDVPALPQDVEDNSLACQIVQSYSNPGDDVTFDKPKTYFEIANITYHVSEIKCRNPHDECDIRDPLTKECLHYKTTADCSADINVTIPMQSKTTNLDDIWKNTVAGQDSIFRRIYPKTGDNSPVSCIADIPGVSNITYTSAVGPDIDHVLLPDGSGTGQGSEGKSIDTQVYFPHLGGIADYFLKGIQTALRPQGYGEQIASGQCSNVVCGELPKLPKATGSCNLGSTSSRVGKIPQSLKDIISAAAETYKVPPNLILGVMYGEGHFNPRRFNWSDDNVKNWATCQKVPSCNETGDDNFMGFNGNDWEVIKTKILPDLKKIDPGKKVADRCNLLDAIYGLAWNLHDSADGGGGMPAQCFGIGLTGPIPSSCDWEQGQYGSAIQVAENGYDPGCFTLPGSCATGGGKNALCPGLGDTCEQIGGPHTSHFACVWDVGHGQ